MSFYPLVSPGRARSFEGKVPRTRHASGDRAAQGHFRERLPAKPYDACFNRKAAPRPRALIMVSLNRCLSGPTTHYWYRLMSLSRRSLLAAAAVIPLAGCGFRLRGRFELPFEKIYLDMNRNTPFTARIARLLRAGSNVTIVDSAEQAQAILKLTRQSRERNIISYNANGEAREYELKYIVQFQLTTPRGTPYLPETTLVAVREISYDDSDYLSRDNEEALVISEMQSDLATQIIRRIERAEPVKESDALEGRSNPAIP